MDRRALARAVGRAAWTLLLASVVVVYAWLVVLVLDSVFGPARQAFAALIGALPP